MSNLSCGCTPDASGFGYCSKCVKALRLKIWNKMSDDDKNYDRHFAPVESSYLDDISKNYVEECCSCHINPPCNYCVTRGE